MWARIVEILLALWLFGSHWLFPMEERFIWIPLFIVLFAALSFIGALNKMHLLQVLPAAHLLYAAFSYPTPWLPFGLQNDILIALLLLMFALIPSRASEPPRPWKKFLKKREK